MGRGRETKLKISPESVTRFREKLKVFFRRARGRNLGSTIKELAPIVRGWVAYFRLAESDKVLGDLDRWIRRRLRWLLWRQWKKPKTRYRKLREHGVTADQAARAIYNGRGAWWNSAASHMNRAIPNSMLSSLGLVSLLQERQRLTHAL